jgi:hypothetical protein
MGAFLIIVQVRKSTTDIFRQALLLQRGVVGYFGDLIRLIRILATYESILDSFEIWVHYTIISRLAAPP